MGRTGRRSAIVALGLAVLVTATGWYLAAHPRGHTHFDSCRVLSDDVIVLEYTYGIGDTVTASARSDSDGVVVSLHIRPPSGSRPALGLRGELRHSVEGGLSRTPVRDVDGTALTCV